MAHLDLHFWGCTWLLAWLIGLDSAWLAYFAIAYNILRYSNYSSHSSPEDEKEEDIEDADMASEIPELHG